MKELQFRGGGSHQDSKLFLKVFCPQRNVCYCFDKQPQRSPGFSNSPSFEANSNPDQAAQAAKNAAEAYGRGRYGGVVLGTFISKKSQPRQLGMEVSNNLGVVFRTWKCPTVQQSLVKV